MENIENKFSDNESEEKLRKYLGRVLKLLVEDTIITMDDEGVISIKTPFEYGEYSRIRYFDVWIFVEYCKDMYGLTREESIILWGEYMNEINQILKFVWGVSQPEYN